jgi:hypothetical protein
LVIGPDSADAAREYDLTDQLMCKLRQSANLRGLAE